MGFEWLYQRTPDADTQQRYLRKSKRFTDFQFILIVSQRQKPQNNRFALNRREIESFWNMSLAHPPLNTLVLESHSTINHCIAYTYAGCKKGPSILLNCCLSVNSRVMIYVQFLYGPAMSDFGSIGCNVVQGLLASSRLWSSWAQRYRRSAGQLTDLLAVSSNLVFGSSIFKTLIRFMNI